MTRRWLVAGLVLCAAAAVAAVGSRRPPVPVAPAAPDTTATSPGASAVAGWKAVVDPATGEIVGRPTADDLGRLGPSRLGGRRPAAELESFDLPSGARGVVLDDWADHSLRVVRGADGALEVVCSQGDEHRGMR